MAILESDRIYKIYLSIDKLASKGRDYIYEYHKLIDETVDKGEYNLFEQALVHYYQIDLVPMSNLKDVKSKTWDDILFQTVSPFQKKLKKLLDKKKVYQMSFDIYSDSVSNVQITIGDPLSSTYSVTSSTQSVALTRTNDNIYISSNDTNLYKYEIYKCGWDIIDGVEQPVSESLIQKIETATPLDTIKTEIPTSHGRPYLIRTYSRSENLNIEHRILNYKVVISRSQLLGSIVEKDVFSEDVSYYLQNKEFAKLMGTRKTYLEVKKVGEDSSILIDSDDPNTKEETNLLNRYTLAINYLLQ